MIPPKPTQGSWNQKGVVLDHRSKARVIQAIINSNGTVVLIVTKDGEELWKDGRITTSNYASGNMKWINHPMDPSLLLLIGCNRLYIHKWDGLNRVGMHEEGISFNISPDLGKAVVTTDWVMQSGIPFLFQAVQSGQTPRVAFIMLKTENLANGQPEWPVSCIWRNIVAGVKCVLTISRSSIIFLDRGGWVCSLSTKNMMDATSYSRHFFFPSIWRLGGEFLVKMASKNTLVVGYKDEVIVVHNLVDFSHRVDFISFSDEGELPLVLRRRVTNL